MFEICDNNPTVNVPRGEFERLLGYPRDHGLDGRADELAKWARQWYAQHGKPWLYARHIEGLHMIDGVPQIRNRKLASTRLAREITTAGAHDLFVVAVSAGSACEEMTRTLWEEGKPDEYYFLEIYGSAVVEHLLASTAFRLCEWAESRGLSVLPHDSPGYPGWNISDQETLRSLIAADRGALPPEEIEVLHSGMLRPKKSLLAAYGIAPRHERSMRLTDQIPCENCSLPACRYRRVPYTKPLPRIEGIGLQGTFESIWQRAIEPAYSFNTRALSKWTDERLHMTFCEDRSVRARFRYSGTTCTNLGRPLEFDYLITLGPAGAGFEIRDVSCVPAPGDAGHRYMCEYIERPGPFMQMLGGEKPLIGRSLSEVFNWPRPFAPSGCFCSRESRDYKWGLVYEVLHFALARYNGTAINHPLEQAT